MVFHTQVVFIKVFTRGSNLLAEIVAMSNIRGGIIFIGIDGVTGVVSGFKNGMIKNIGINSHNAKPNKPTLNQNLSKSVSEGFAIGE